MAIEIPSLIRKPAIRLVDRARRTDALKLLPGLLESQWWEPAKLELLQRARLAELGRFCVEEVPYYRDLFAKTGLGELTPESLEKLPLMSKEIIRREGKALRSNSFDRWQPRPKSTSGSTGMPLNYFLDRPSHSFQWAQLWRGWEQMGYLPGDLYATLSGGSLLPEKVDLKQKIYLALSRAIHLPSYHLTDTIMDEYVKILRRKTVGFLYGYPSSVGIFAEYLLGRKDRVMPMRAIFTTSEAMSPQTREVIEKAFGCPVIDTYGCNDGGIYSFECEHGEGYHVGMESVFVEILDDDGRRLPDGETGNIVTTNLPIRAMPLMRYMTGDVGAISREPCVCGRGLLRIVKLQGRDRDVILTPAGRKVHGAFFNHFEPFYHADWLKRFQVYQPELKVLILRLEVHREPTAAERQTILDELLQGLGEMDFRLEIVDSIELTRTGKFRVVISDLS